MPEIESKLVERFFHKTTIARRRRRRRSIFTRLKDDRGDWIDNEEELREVARDFYSNLYKIEQCIPIENTEFVALTTLTREV